MWDCISAELLHRINIWSDSPDKELAALSWNRGLKDHYMFAIGTQDGEIQIWKSQVEGEGSEDVRGQMTPVLPPNDPRITGQPRPAYTRYSSPGGYYSDDYSSAAASPVSTPVGRT